MAVCVAVCALPSAASAHGLRWTAAPRIFTPTFGLMADDITCPSTHLCLAGTSGGVLVSTNPTGGPSAWKLTAVPPVPSEEYSPAIYDVSCPSTSLCVAYAPGGEILTTSDPTGGQSAWRVTPRRHGWPILDGGVVACASTSLCIAFAVGGHQMLVSTDPLTGAWKQEQFGRVYGLDDATCIAPHLCLVATGTYPDVLSSTHPQGGPSAWVDTQPQGRPKYIKGGGTTVTAVGCMSARNCYAALTFYFYRSAHPTQSHKWGQLFFETGLKVDVNVFDAACVLHRFCVFSGGGTRVLTATGGNSVTTARIPGATQYDNYAPTCVSAHFCALLSETGKLVIGTG